MGERALPFRPFRRLLAEHSKLKADVLLLLSFLKKRGVISDVEWHRERFAQELRRTGWSPGDVSLKTAAETEPIITRIASSAGEVASRLLSGASRSFRSCMDSPVGEKLYVIGGEPGIWNTSTFAPLDTWESFSPQRVVWEPCKPMGPSRVGHTGAVINGRVYICGGAPLTVSRTVVQFDPPQRRWAYMPQMRAQRLQAAAVALGEQLYICGGTDGANIWQTAERLRPDDLTAQWEDMPPMLERRYRHAAVAFQGCMLALGGQDDPTETHSGDLCAVECLRPHAKWVQAHPMTVPRFALGAATFQGSVYASGGLPSELARGSMERYDPEAETWELLRQDGPSRCCHRAAVLGGRLYIFGGFLPNDEPFGHASRSVQRFIPETSGWENMEPMLQPRHSFFAAVA